MDLLAMDLAAGLQLEEFDFRPLREGEAPTRLIGSTTIARVGFMVDAIQVRREDGGVQVAADGRDEEDLEVFARAACSDGGFATVRVPGFGERRYALFLFPYDE